MSEIVVGGDRNIANPNSRTFGEREEELQALEAVKRAQLKRESGSPFIRWSQKNLERTKELVWLALNYPAARAVLDVFEDKMDKKNAAVCSKKTLCEILGVSRPTVDRAVNILFEKGFICILKTGKENVYAVNDTICWKNHGNKRWMSCFPANVILSLSEQDAEMQERVYSAAADGADEVEV